MKKILSICMFLLLLLLVACGKQSDGDVLIEVNGQAITEEELLKTLETTLGTNDIPEETIELYGSFVLQSLVTNKLLQQEGEALDISYEDEAIQAEIEMYKQISGAETDEDFLEVLKMTFDMNSEEEFIDEFIIPAIAFQQLSEEVTEEQIEKKFNEQKDDFIQVRARHILVEDEQVANDLYEKLQNGDDFEQLAREHSKDYSKNEETGDESGIEYTFGKGEMVQEFEKQAFEQEIGVVSEPVKTEYGYHIIETLEKIDPTLAEHEFDIRQQIVIDQLIEKADIKVIDPRFEDIFKINKTDRS